jgi:hypothetical protein
MGASGLLIDKFADLGAAIGVHPLPSNSSKRLTRSLSIPTLPSCRPDDKISSCIPGIIGHSEGLCHPVLIFSLC